MLPQNARVTHDNFIRRPRRYARLNRLGRVCRLGLATRGDTALSAEAVERALAQGVNYLNWPGLGHSDGLTAAVRNLGPRRRRVVVAGQFFARTAPEARTELAAILGEIESTYIDVLTYYYVEDDSEWKAIQGRNGAGRVLAEARADGRVRAIGVTSHQRALAATMAVSGAIDLLMIRYNAAHRGAEEEIFPITGAGDIPVVAYTAQRWGALMMSTPDDPSGFAPPGAQAWYRFVLCHPSVSVCLMAPESDDELGENLELLDRWRGMSLAEYERLRKHGDRVHRHGGAFP